MWEEEEEEGSGLLPQVGGEVEAEGGSEWEGVVVLEE